MSNTATSGREQTLRDDENVKQKRLDRTPEFVQPTLQSRSHEFKEVYCEAPFPSDGLVGDLLGVQLRAKLGVVWDPSEASEARFRPNQRFKWVNGGVYVTCMRRIST
jgi:hypothetical protein